MTNLLWQKPGVAVDAEIQRFLAGDDVVLDREFFLHDIQASTAHAEGLRLLDAIDRALAQSPLLEAARQEEARAAAGVDRARAGFLPRLGGSYGYTHGDLPVYAFGSKLNQGRFTQEDFAVQRLNDPDPIDNFRAALTLFQPLYAGGKVTCNCPAGWHRRPCRHVRAVLA